LLHDVQAPARDVNIVPSLVSNLLLSTSKFAEAGYTAIYDKDNINFYNARTTKITALADAVLKGLQCSCMNLWCIPLVPFITNLNMDTLILDHPSGKDSLNSMYTIKTNQLARKHVALQMCKNHCQEYLHNVNELPSIEPTIWYLHGAAGFPTKASWLKAIRKGNYLSWPLINVKNVAKYFPESKETQKGHMRGQRQGAQSTKVAKPTEDAPTTLPHQKKNDILITEHKVKSLMYADHTGLFPAILSLGNKYVMILHHVDSNSSWLEAMQNQSGGELILARARALAWMQRCRLIPKHQIFNNQASAEYKATIEASGMTYELVPPKEHQCNMAEKAIQTFKDHFVGVLSGCAPSMPIHLWCQLLPQVERQLLLLRQSHVHPNLSVYAHVYKHHNYNWHPFVPIGMEALVHDKPHKCRIYAEHCTKAFVLGTSTKHYQCWKFWTPTTPTTHISGAAFFKHKYLTNLSVTPEDQVIAAAAHLTDTLQGIKSPQLHTSTLQALSDLHDVFYEATNATNAPPSLQRTPPQGRWHLYHHATHRQSLKHATVSCHHCNPHAHLQGCNPTWHQIWPQYCLGWKHP
jgi:hypothetical protein